MKRWFIILALCSSAVWAGEAPPRAEDPQVEGRLVVLAEELRCLVCQNESLASSNAELAEDLRREVRKLIRQGMTDAEIKTYLVERYGDFVLLRPPVTAATMLLWATPILALGGGIAVIMLRRRRALAEAAALSPEEARRLAELDRGAA